MPIFAKLQFSQYIEFYADRSHVLELNFLNLQMVSNIRKNRCIIRILLHILSASQFLCLKWFQGSWISFPCWRQFQVDILSRWVTRAQSQETNKGKTQTHTLPFRQPPLVLPYQGHFFSCGIRLYYILKITQHLQPEELLGSLLVSLSYKDTVHSQATGILHVLHASSTCMNFLSTLILPHFKCFIREGPPQPCAL